MKLFQGLFAVLAASTALMGGAEAKPRSASIHFCKACVDYGSGKINWNYDVRLVIKDCYNRQSGGIKGPSSKCPAADFSIPIDSGNDVQAKWANKAGSLSVKYDGHWNKYKTKDADRTYKDGNKDCYEFYDTFEPTICNVPPPSTSIFRAALNNHLETPRA
ncbi:hypothetical protein GGI12_005749 [Dipsacomyces acuminosporus]|nr:hypothetical protein GGI12_005749 [Dipsacomyces acuminosporus]